MAAENDNLEDSVTRLHKMCFALMCLMAGMATAQAEDFYKGKTLTLLVGFSPGGGFDINARLLARHLGRHIKGQPDVVVTNMPGASSYTSIQFLETRAPKDGTYLDTFNFALVADSKMFPERVKVDLRNYGWVGSISVDVTACYVWRGFGVKSLDEVRKKPIVHMGDVGQGTSAYVNQNILKRIFGVNVQKVLGYPGSAEQRLAIERGELDGDCGAWASIPVEWIDGDKILPLLKSQPSVVPGMPDNIPYMADIAPDEHARNLIKLLTASSGVGRPFIASKDVPAERLQILRQAFDETMKDPAFLADAAKLRMPVTPKNAAESRQVLDEIYGASADLVKEAREIAGD